MSRRSRGTSASSYDDDNVQRKQKKKFYREAGVLEEDYSHYSHYSGSMSQSGRRGSSDHRSSTRHHHRRHRSHDDDDIDVSLSTSSSYDDDDPRPPRHDPDTSPRRTPTVQLQQERAAMATSVMLQLEQQQRVLEARQKQILKKEKAMAKEQKALARQRQEEEEMRQLKETLDELERREQLEKEEQERERVAKAEMKRQIKKAERKAKKAAQEAEKARRKAEEEAEQAQRKAAQLETARLIAEEETERAKRQAAAETAARRRTQAAAIQAQREAEARILEMDRQVQASNALLSETAEKLREAEQKAAQHVALTETEAQRAKRQAVAEADSRRRAQAEAIQAKREAEARIQEMDQQVQASRALLNETADKLREAERKATLDATRTEMETERAERQAAVEAGGRQKAQAEAMLAKMEASARILEMDRQLQAPLNQTVERKAKVVHREQGNDVSMNRSGDIVIIDSSSEPEEVGTDSPPFRGSGEYSMVYEVSSLPKSTRMQKMYESNLDDVHVDSPETSSDESSSEDEEYSSPQRTVPSMADIIHVGERGNETESDDEVIISSESGSEAISSDEEEYSASESVKHMTNTTVDDGEHVAFSESEYSESELESESLGESTPPSVSKRKGSGMEVSMDLEDVFNSEDPESPMKTPSARKTKKLFIKKNQVSEKQLLKKKAILPVQNGSSLKEESMELNDVFNANSPLKTHSPRKKRFFARDRQPSKKTKKNASGSSDLSKSLSESGNRDSNGDKKNVKTKSAMNASMPGQPGSKRPKLRRAVSSLDTGRAHPLRKGSSMDGSRFFSWNNSRVTEDKSTDGNNSRIRSPKKKLNESRSFIPGKAALDDNRSTDFNASQANMSLTNSRLTGLATPRRGVNPNNPRMQMSRMDSRMQMSRMDSRLQMSRNESRMQMSRNDSHKNMGSSHSRMNMSGHESRISVSWDIEAQRSKKKFERPPRSLVLIWLLVAGEMGFDLATTSVAFRSLLDDDRCCGKRIDMGQMPMSVTIPFFCLVSTEIALLLRAIILTLFPSLGEAEYKPNGEVYRRSTFMHYVCCCLRLEVAVIMRILSIVVLLNPFFGCVIAWILLYQSNRKEAFMVLGFEGGSLLLHYISVMIEGAIVNLWTLFLHGLIPLIPFSVAIGLTMFYLKQGGVCYLVADKVFLFNGCEVCLDGYPPVEGLCRFQNGTTYRFEEQNALRDLADASDLKDLTARTTQVSYCANENPGGPNVNFCFFDFEDGLLASVIHANATKPQSVN